MAKLTYKERKKLPSSSFVEPKERKYPIPDPSHARNALARVSASGSPMEKKKVSAEVHSKFPSIGKDKSKSKMKAEHKRAGKRG